jgi:mono/diheme cytochrome c family protein
LLLFVLLLGAATSRGETPAEVFENSCASCHGVDGKAHTPMGRKSRAGDLSASKLDDAAIERQIREGSKDAHRANRMPAFADKLTPEQIKALIEHVKSFRPKQS